MVVGKDATMSHLLHGQDWFTDKVMEEVQRSVMDSAKHVDDTLGGEQHKSSLSGPTKW